ncbi:MAG: hypothetical protein V4574_03205 [Pseudomonadota bacterium]
MRWVHPAWKALGIDPTSDTRAIRIAYAARLKEIDPESDPQAFIALREAFETARIQAQWVDLPDDEDADEEDFDDLLWDEDEDAEPWTPSGDLYTIRPSGHVPAPPPPDPAWQAPAPPEDPAPAPEPPAEPSRASPWAPITPAVADAHTRALATLLYAHDSAAQPWPTPAQKDEMLTHWRAIIADPRMQEVAYYADAERWFSELIARTAAFSDPLVIPATEVFGWLRSDGAITQTPAVAQVTRRYRALEFLAAVEQRKHPLNPAWRELCRPAGESSRRGWVSGRKVRQLLRIVRAHYPDLEGCFDWYRVGLWDGSIESGGRGGVPWWGIVIFIVIVVRVIASLGDGPGEPARERTPATSPGGAYAPPVQVLPPGATPPVYFAPPEPVPFLDGALEQSDADLDQALERLYGDKLDIATIALSDPALYKALVAFWAREKAAGIRKQAFAENLRAFLDRRGPPLPRR